MASSSISFWYNFFSIISAIFFLNAVFKINSIFTFVYLADVYFVSFRFILFNFSLSSANLSMGKAFLWPICENPAKLANLFLNIIGKHWIIRQIMWHKKLYSEIGNPYCLLTQMKRDSDAYTHTHTKTQSLAIYKVRPTCALNGSRLFHIAYPLYSS